ncbi:MAG: META domain-containing protein [Trueperaceae bacterium]
MTRFYARVAAALVVVLSAAACAPLSRGVGAGEATGLVTLPSGEVCGYAGEGATLAFDGLRLSWTCEVAPSGPRGLFGEPVVLGDTNVSWRIGSTARRADGGGFELARLESVDARVVRFTTVTGSSCAFAGEGATLAFGGERVNYTCDGDEVAVGSLTGDARGLSATIGTLERTDDAVALRRPRSVRIRTVELQDPSTAWVPPATSVAAAAPVDEAEKADEAPSGEAPGQVAHAPLLGTSWALERILFMDDSEVLPVDPADYTLTLGADGSVSLQIDCNRGIGRFELDGPSLSFSPFATTRAFCGPGSLEQRYLEQIAIVVSYGFEDGALVLATSMDSSLLFFRPLD